MIITRTVIILPCPTTKHVKSGSKKCYTDVLKSGSKKCYTDIFLIRESFIDIEFICFNKYCELLPFWVDCPKAIVFFSQYNKVFDVAIIAKNALTSVFLQNQNILIGCDLLYHTCLVVTEGNMLSLNNMLYSKL